MLNKGNKEKVRILVLTEIFAPEIGSGANRLTNIVNELIVLNYEVKVVTSEPKYPNKSIYDDEEFLEDDRLKDILRNAEVKRIKASKTRMNKNFFTRLYDYLRIMCLLTKEVLLDKKEYDLVIGTIPNVFVGIAAVVAKKKMKCKLILDIRDLWPECIKNIGIFRKSKIILKLSYILEKYYIKKANGIIINSNGYREYLENKYDIEKLIFIPNGISNSELEYIKGIKEEKNEKFTIIYTGLIGMAQNVKSIVKAANVLRKHKNIQFKIIGTGVMRESLEVLIKRYGLKNLELIDPMPKRKVLKQLKQADVALVHLRGDSAFDLVIPGKIIDYMSIGIPIIAGVEGYTANLIKESGVGIVIEPDDYKKMAKEILEMYSQKEKLNQYSQKCEEYCKENFMWEKNIKKVDLFIKEILKDGAKDIDINIKEVIESEEKSLSNGMESIYK